MNIFNGYLRLMDTRKGKFSEKVREDNFLWVV